MQERSEPASAEIRVLAVASEIGSSKAIAPVLQSLIRRGARVKVYLANAALRFAEQLGIARDIDIRPISQIQSLDRVTEDFRAHAVLVGTTAVDSLERRLTVYARQSNILSVAVVDERYGYRRRFSDNRGAVYCLPDGVALMDDECYRDALREGLPGPRLRVTGSPLLSHLAYHAPALLKYQGGPGNMIGSSWGQVLFVSETIARDNGSSPRHRGRLGDFLGFTEETIRRDILSSLQEVGRPALLIEKLHPSDDRSPEQGWIEGQLFWKRVKEDDLWSLVLQSDVVIGMRSMALLEAALLGRRVASYQPNLIGENQCAAVHFGIAARLDTRQDLKEWVLCNLSAKSPCLASPKNLPFIRPDAAERVADLVLGMG